jgi:hypothetical protein
MNINLKICFNYQENKNISSIPGHYFNRNLPGPWANWWGMSFTLIDLQEEIVNGSQPWLVSPTALINDNELVCTKYKN